MNLAAQILLKNAFDCIAKDKLDESEELLKKALNCAPNNHDILRCMSVVAALKTDYARALSLINQVIAIAPHDGVAHSNRGNILQALGQHEDALLSFNEAIRLFPTYAEAYNNKANVLQELYRFEDALVWYDKAIAIDPSYAKAYKNKGNALEWLRRHEEAMACFDIATSVDPSYVDAYWQKGLSQLASGNFQLGWQNYEARWTKSIPVKFQHAGVARLESLNNLHGKKLIVWAEQGLGDSIQFCRYIKPLSQTGAQITFLVHDQLLDIFNPLRAFCDLRSGLVYTPKDFDFQTPLMSLPLLFGTDLNTILQEIPYLEVKEEKKKLLQKALHPSTNLRVGVVWSGGHRPIHLDGYLEGERRNIALDQIAFLGDLNGIDFYSLQKGDPAESELAAKKKILWPDIINCAPLINDFTDTAALLDSLDLLISVDTSTAHLAGALGKPVWILNRYDSCWRWLRGRDDSPWYPTAKIYHQMKAADWTEVIERVKVDLAKLVESR